jgi:hypothetical protein
MLAAALTGAIALPGAARADVFYAVSNYENGSAGIITKDGGAFSVRDGAVSNFGVDAAGFTFRDHGGAERAMIREYQYGPNDTVYVWDPASFSRPLYNSKAWGSNIHAAASDGRYLYLTTYESYKDGSGAQDTGEVVRVDMADGYKPDKRYRYEAFTGEAGFKSSPHGEAIHIEGGKAYVLFGVSYKGVNEYEPTEIVEFDAELNRLRSVKLKDAGGNIGKNAMRMAAYGGKLYVANMGGYQGPDSWGDLWEADIETMTARKLLDGHDIPYTVGGEEANVGMYGIQFAADGTAFLLAGSYGADYAFRARLFVTTAERLSKGDAGAVAAEFTGTRYRGYSWDVLWDEKDAALWVMAGTRLEARDKSGRLLREFTPAELGDNIYTVALLDGDGAAALPDAPAEPSAPTLPDALMPAAPTLPGAPEGVETASPVFGTDAKAFAGLSGFDESAFVKPEGMDYLTLDGGLAAQSAGMIWEGKVQDTNPLPVFSAKATAPGGTVAVALDIKGSGLLADAPPGINLIKALPGKDPIQFKYRPDGYGDGNFRLQNAEGETHTGAIDSDATYRLVLFIKDDGDYDLDREDSQVADPAVIVRTADGGGDDDGNAGSGGGGCASGASVMALMLAAAYMTSKRRAAGRRHHTGGKRAPFTALIAALLLLTAPGLAEAALIKLLVTPGAGVRAFSKDGATHLQTAHFVPFSEYSLTKGNDEGGYETYSFEADGERFHYVAGGGGSGFLKTAEVVYVRADETEKSVTIDVERLDPSRREDNGFKGDGVYLNANDAQHIVLDAGETFWLIPTRVWQAEEGFTENYFIEPDYEIEVLGNTGAVSSEWAGAPGLEYAEITARKPGVAVIRLTYGPILFKYGDGKGEYYNPIDPLNAGIVVVTVPEAGKGKKSGIATGINAREYDTVYFDRAESDHAEYAFKPAAGGGVSVRSHRPLHDGTAWGAGWSDGAKNTDGSFTVKLYDGRNVVEVSSTGAAFSEYHVINAKGIDVNVRNLTDAGWKKGDALSPGDRLEISFGGIKTPLEKIAGIYNPGFPDTCYVKYEAPDGEEIRGGGVQYDLSENNTLAVTVPASAMVRLRKGLINCDHMGDPLGSHRARIGVEPVYPNFTAVNVKGVYCVMPDITLGVAVTDAGVTDDGGASHATEGDVKGLLPDVSIISVATDSTVTVSARAFRDGLADEDRAAVDAGTISPLPVTVSETEEGGTALVTFRLRPGGFVGEALGSVTVLKMKQRGSVARLNAASSREALSDGLFVWADAEGRAVAQSEKIEADKEYLLTVAVKDGGTYDLDGQAQGRVVDPLAIALKNAELENTETEDGDGGSGGGCDAGAAALAGIIALAAALLKTRKREGGF